MQGRTSDDGWHPKPYFRVGMNTPTMVAQQPVFIDKKPSDAWLYELGLVLGGQNLSIADTGGKFNMYDTDPFKHGPTVSFLNLETVEAVGERTGWNIDPRRFRMAVWYRAPAFSELDWVTEYKGERQFVAGGIPFKFQDMCERCEAVEANPDTGERDLNLLDALDDVHHKRGYRGSPQRGVLHVMGFLATPLSDGQLGQGHEIRLLQR